MYFHEGRVHMATFDFGVIGLAVMGENLVLNIERNGFSVVVFNRTAKIKDQFISGRASGKKIGGANTIEDFAKMLKTPRKMQIMVKAGQAVDQGIEQLI